MTSPPTDPRSPSPSWGCASICDHAVGEARRVAAKLELVIVAAHASGRETPEEAAELRQALEGLGVPRGRRAGARRLLRDLLDRGLLTERPALRARYATSMHDERMWDALTAASDVCGSPPRIKLLLNARGWVAAAWFS